MRITNKIMQNNQLANINSTKESENTLSAQMSGKKLSRPSDDPVVAIRSLRLRSSVTQISQYYTSNIPDASSWLKTTQDALNDETEVITSMLAQYNKGVNQYLTSSDRSVILEQLKSLRDEVYTTGNADYAGRYIFTGYRTESPLTFQKAEKTPHLITQQLTASDLKTDTHVCTTFPSDGTAAATSMDLSDLTSGTVNNYTNVTEQNIANNTYHRIRLAYHDTDAITTTTDAGGNTITSGQPVINYYDATGNLQTITVTDSAKSTDIPSPYDTISAAGNENKAIYLADTGELLLGSTLYATLSGTTDNTATQTTNEATIFVTYQKTEFAQGDLRPEHYFYTRTAGTDGTLSSATGVGASTATGDDVVYNADYLTGTTEKQVIEYDVGFNQRLQVNTTADEAFNPSITREIDDMINSLNNLSDIENVVTTLKSALSSTTDTTQKATVQKQLDAANKAYSYAKENVKNLFGSGMTAMQSYLDQVNVASTDCGARASRLELVENRTMTQKSTFEELKSSNEDTDLSTTAVQLKSAELTYEAALQATAKIMKTNLMQYI